MLCATPFDLTLTDDQIDALFRPGLSPALSVALEADVELETDMDPGASAEVGA